MSKYLARAAMLYGSRELEWDIDLQDYRVLVDAQSLIKSFAKTKVVISKEELELYAKELTIEQVNRKNKILYPLSTISRIEFIKYMQTELNYPLRELRAELKYEEIVIDYAKFVVNSSPIAAYKKELDLFTWLLMRLNIEYERIKKLRKETTEDNQEFQENILDQMELLKEDYDVLIKVKKSNLKNYPEKWPIKLLNYFKAICKYYQLIDQYQMDEYARLIRDKVLKGYSPQVFFKNGQYNNIDWESTIGSDRLCLDGEPLHILLLTPFLRIEIKDGKLICEISQNHNIEDDTLLTLLSNYNDKLNGTLLRKNKALLVPEYMAKTIKSTAVNIKNHYELGIPIVKLEDFKTMQWLSQSEKPARTINPPISDGTKWEDIAIEFRDSHNVNIKINSKLHCKTNYRDMGFENSKTQKPNVQWGFLEELSGQDGEITWHKLNRMAKYRRPIEETEDYLSAEEDENTQIQPNKPLGKHAQFEKYKERLSKGLKQYFGISSDPFYPYKEYRGYKLKLGVCQL